MKCLIFSDSHGSVFYMQKALAMHRDAEVVFFLGDGIYDFDAVASSDRVPRTWIAVRGNCDFHRYFLGRDTQEIEEITFMGKKIVLTHGDLFGVKGTLSHLELLAKERGADVVLFGHTHIPHESYVSEGGFYLFNPGSISSPSYSYGILTLGDSILFSHGSFC